MSKTDKLIEAYNLLKGNCEEHECCEECEFYGCGEDACSIASAPIGWYFCRYSKDEADLADILRKYGAESITKINGNVFWKSSDLLGGVLPKRMFYYFDENEEIPIEEIAKYSGRQHIPEMIQK